MTTAKPRRTVLPPNLTRNYYEVKRLITEGEGRGLPHWYQLTAEQQKAEGLEVELFRRAILRSEEEQDLVARFNAPAAEQPTAAAETTTSETAPCKCPGCSTTHALSELLRQAERLEASLGWDIASDGQGAAVYAFKLVSLTEQEHADLQKRASEAIARWVADGRPVKLTGLAPSPRPGLYGLGSSWSDPGPWLTRRQATTPKGFLRDL
ncbi:hypothetical protein ACF08W_28670 [Streptomyces sp. NPDC015144]|uniref:hypothetical protein n=1 Tax=Streptomyces sp. NPDC015144 TaxID=3364944 RepID=UPI0036FE1B19